MYFCWSFWTPWEAYCQTVGRQFFQLFPVIFYIFCFLKNIKGDRQCTAFPKCSHELLSFVSCYKHMRNLIFFFLNKNCDVFLGKKKKSKLASLSIHIRQYCKNWMDRQYSIQQNINVPNSTYITVRDLKNNSGSKYKSIPIL